MNKDWIFSDDNSTCALRVAGVLIKDTMILVQKVTIYPAFLKEEIYHLHEPIKHFISKG